MIWLSPQLDPDLERGRIHVWRTRLDQPDALLPGYLQCLSEDEGARAMSFVYQQHRRDYAVVRAFLRTVLGRYLEMEPAQVAFASNTYGKPCVATGSKPRPWFFNLTHSHHLALLAVTREAEIGIDVEHLRHVDDGIPERYFSPSEIAALRALPEQLQQEAFFNCWTRKEADIKARGLGLSLALDEFDVSLAPGQPAAILEIRGGGEQASAWDLVHLAPEDDYIAALAVHARNCELKFWTIDPP